MKLLLDTQAFLWLIGGMSEVSEKAVKLFTNKNNTLLISLASLWEIAIKVSIGKLILQQPLEHFLSSQLQENGIAQLNIDFRHVVKVTDLPFHHRDPFDRLIISQALVENLPVISSDSAFDDYGIERLW